MTPDELKEFLADLPTLEERLEELAAAERELSPYSRRCLRFLRWKGYMCELPDGTWTPGKRDLPFPQARMRCSKADIAVLVERGLAVPIKFDRSGKAIGVIPITADILKKGAEENAAFLKVLGGAQ